MNFDRKRSVQQASTLLNSILIKNVRQGWTYVWISPLGPRPTSNSWPNRYETGMKLITLQNWLSELPKYTSEYYVHGSGTKVAGHSFTTAALFRANDAGQLSSTDIDGTWQWPTQDFNRIDQCLVLVFWTNCNFRCLVQTNVAAAFLVAAFMDGWSPFWSQISCVLCGPTVRTLYSCWNHQDCWTTWHVTNCTRSWVFFKWITAAVYFGKDVVVTISRIVQLIFCSGEISCKAIL